MNIGIKNSLKKLKLSGIAGSIDVRNHEAISRELTYMEFLELILEDETAQRNDRRIERMIKVANFRDRKTLEQFDFDFNKSINRKEIFDLATSQYISTFDNILFLGSSGVGKSHFAQALGLCAIVRGFSVLYRSAFTLATELSEANILGKRKEMINFFSKTNLLIIDDFGLKSLPGTAAEDFLEILMRRYETNSTILTSNRTLEDFGIILNDKTAAMAILDRFLHHAHIVKIIGPSYRLKNKKRVSNF